MAHHPRSHTCLASSHQDADSPRPQAMLEALPTDCLATITKLAGRERAQRAASKHLLHIYGPLDCGLCPTNLPTISTLSHVLSHPNRCAHLHTLNLSATHSRVDNSTLLTISRHCTALQTLLLTGCRRITDPGLQHLSPLASALQNLDLTGCTSIGPSTFSTLLPLTCLSALTVPEFKGIWSTEQRSCLLQLSTLTTLRVLESPSLVAQLRNFHLSTLTRMPNLHNLFIPDCRNLDTQGYSQLSALQSLTSLTLDCCWKLVPDCLPRITALFRLQHLRISGTVNISVATQHLSSLPDLRDLDLTIHHLTDQILAHLASITSLTRLCIHPDVGSSHPPVIDLSSMAPLSSNLKSLTLPFLPPSPWNFEHLGDLSALHTLSLAHSPPFACIMQIAPSLPHLRKLILGGPDQCNISEHLPELTSSLCSHPHSRHNSDTPIMASVSASLSDEQPVATASSQACTPTHNTHNALHTSQNPPLYSHEDPCYPTINPSPTPPVTALLPLTHMELRYSGIDDTILFQVSAQLRNLRRLDLRHGKAVTDTGLLSLRFITSLEYLRLASCDGVTDAGLEVVGHLRRLRWLGLAHCHGFNGEGLSAVKVLEEIREIVLDGCGGLRDEGLWNLIPLPSSLQVLRVARCRGVSRVCMEDVRGQCGDAFVEFE